MAERHRVGGDGTWDATAGSKRALTQGGAGGQTVPDSTMDVFFDNGANTVTISGTRSCKTINFTGFSTGTLNGTSTPKLQVYGNVTLISTMTRGTAGAINMLSAGTINSGGLTACPALVFTLGGATTVSLGADYTTTGTVTRGSQSDFDNGGYTLTCGAFGAGNYTKTITLQGSSILNCTAFDLGTGTLTVNPNTSTIKMINTTTATFAGRGKTYYNLELNGSSTSTTTTLSGDNTFNNLVIATKLVAITGTNTYADLGLTMDGQQTVTITAGKNQTVTTLTCTGTATKQKYLISSTTSTRGLICASGTIAVAYTGLYYSAASGGATFNANTTDCCDAGGNSGRNFPADSGNRYWVGGTGTRNTTKGYKWAQITGGAGGYAVPTTSTTVYLDTSSDVVTVAGSSNEVCRNIDCSAFTGTLTSGYLYVGYDGQTASVILSSGMTCSGFSIQTARNCGAFTIDGQGKTIANMYINGASSLNLSSDFGISGELYLQMNNKTISTNGYAFSFGYTTNPNNYRQTWNIQNSTISQTNATKAFSLYSASATVNATGSTIKIAGNGFYGFGKTFANVELNGATCTVTGSNTFTDLKIGSATAQTISFTAGTTQTMTTFTCVGTAGQLKTLKSTTTARFTLSDSGGTNDCDYIAVQDSIVQGGATRNAGVNSVDGGHNTGRNDLVVFNGKIAWI